MADRDRRNESRRPSQGDPRKRRQHEAKLQCSPKARATQHHHARATKVKAACLDSGDVRLGLSRRSPSERANCCATCRQRMDSTPTSARSDARAASGARGAAGGFLVPRVSFKVGFSRGESQNFLSFSFWKENDRIKSGLRPSSETARQGVVLRWRNDCVIRCSI